MTERALRIQRLRRRVAVAATATFTAAFGTVAATGSMGTTSTAATTSVTQDSASEITSTTVAETPSDATTTQS